MTLRCDVILQNSLMSLLEDRDSAQDKLVLGYVHTMYLRRVSYTERIAAILYWQKKTQQKTCTLLFSMEAYCKAKNAPNYARKMRPITHAKRAQ